MGCDNFSFIVARSDVYIVYDLHQRLKMQFRAWMKKFILLPMRHKEVFRMRTMDFSDFSSRYLLGRSIRWFDYSAAGKTSCQQRRAGDLGWVLKFGFYGCGNRRHR
jgi:hypothetical protein